MEFTEFSFTGKIFVPKQKPVQTFTEETISLDPELEEALTSASDTELCDLAGEAWGQGCQHTFPSMEHPRG